MKVSVTQENLSKALNHVLKATALKPNIPVLANVLIRASQGKITFAATDLDISVATIIGGEIAEEGELTVNARLLTEFVSQLNSNRVELLQTGQTLEVKSVDNQAQLYIITAEDFPTLPEAVTEADIVVNSQSFRDAVIRTSIAAAVDQSRPVLTCLYLETSKRKLSVVGVDGFRLARKIISLEKEIEGEINLVVPSKALLELAKITGDEEYKDELLQIFLIKDKNQVLFKVGDVSLSSRLLEGEFPNYRDIIPAEKNFSFSISKDAFAKSVKIVTIFSRNVIGNKTFFRVNADEKNLALAAKVQDMGNNESKAELLEVDGENFETAFNGRFLNDVLSAVSGDTIVFESNGITAPGVFKDIADEDYLHIIMPMRIE